jgi:hypothetical protein
MKMKGFEADCSSSTFQRSKCGSFSSFDNAEENNPVISEGYENGFTA